MSPGHRDSLSGVVGVCPSCRNVSVHGGALHLLLSTHGERVTAGLYFCLGCWGAGAQGCLRAVFQRAHSSEGPLSCDVACGVCVCFSARPWSQEARLLLVFVCVCFSCLLPSHPGRGWARVAGVWPLLSRSASAALPFSILCDDVSPDTVRDAVACARNIPSSWLWAISWRGGGSRPQ